MINNLKYVRENKAKEAFYCSDFGKMEIDIYYSFTGEKETNPPEWYDTLKWSAGKGVEMAMLDILKSNGIVAKDYEQEKHGRVDMKHGAIEIHGYIDAMTTGEKVGDFELEAGCPIEIKSINNANKWDIERYTNMEPRTEYVGQLACYMDYLNKNTGYLFVSAIDGLSRFWFKCERVGDKVYKCGNITVDLNAEYKRWEELYTGYIQPRVEPKCKVRYKIPIEEIDWKSLSKTDIQKARSGAKVIGDEGSWKIQYSKWKNLIVKNQGVELGYSQEELAKINELTSGYTTWKK